MLAEADTAERGSDLRGNDRLVPEVDALGGNGGRVRAADVDMALPGLERFALDYKRDTSKSDPGSAIPGLGVGGEEIIYERVLGSRLRGNDLAKQFVEEVDRVMETISRGTATLCRDWGETVARRYFVKPQPPLDE